MKTIQNLLFDHTFRMIKKRPCPCKILIQTKVYSLQIMINVWLFTFWLPTEQRRLSSRNLDQIDRSDGLNTTSLVPRNVRLGRSGMLFVLRLFRWEVCKRVSNKNNS